MNEQLNNASFRDVLVLLNQLTSPDITGYIEILSNGSLDRYFFENGKVVNYILDIRER